MSVAGLCASNSVGDVGVLLPPTCHTRAFASGVALHPAWHRHERIWRERVRGRSRFDCARRAVVIPADVRKTTVRLVEDRCVRLNKLGVRAHVCMYVVGVLCVGVVACVVCT